MGRIDDPVLDGERRYAGPLGRLDPWLAMTLVGQEHGIRPQVVEHGADGRTKAGVAQQAAVGEAPDLAEDGCPEIEATNVQRCLGSGREPGAGRLEARRSRGLPARGQERGGEHVRRVLQQRPIGILSMVQAQLQDAGPDAVGPEARDDRIQVWIDEPLIRRRPDRVTNGQADRDDPRTRAIPPRGSTLVQHAGPGPSRGGRTLRRLSQPRPPEQSVGTAAPWPRSAHRGRRRGDRGRGGRDRGPDEDLGVASSAERRRDVGETRLVDVDLERVESSVARRLGDDPPPEQALVQPVPERLAQPEPVRDAVDGQDVDEIGRTGPGVDTFESLVDEVGPGQDRGRRPPDRHDVVPRVRPGRPCRVHDDVRRAVLRRLGRPRVRDEDEPVRRHRLDDRARGTAVVPAGRPASRSTSARYGSTDVSQL